MALEICGNNMYSKNDQRAACLYLGSIGVPIAASVSAAVLTVAASWEVAVLACGDGDCTNEVNTGKNIVYEGWKNGQRYIGITKDWAAREAYWARQKMFINPIKYLDNLSRADARAVEQYLIQTYGLDNMKNIINSISVNNPIYQEAIYRAEEILRIINWVK